MTPPNAARGLAIVRVSVATLLAIHGWARLLSGGPPGFGQFLASRGIPLGTAVAWGITVFEMLAPALLAAGRFVRIIAPIHIAILVGGIALVHGREGWFVVGGGRNGVEYSVLLICCLVAVIVGGWPPSRSVDGSGPRP